MSIVNNPEHQKCMSSTVSTPSVREQRGAENECDPFFVNLATLPTSQLDHLRETGLIGGRATTTTTTTTERQRDDDDNLDICLLVPAHVKYLSRVWNNVDSGEPQLNPSFVTLDSSRPWMIYWTLHSCDLMGTPPTACRAIVETLAACFSVEPTQIITLSQEQVQKDRVLAALVETKDTSTDNDDKVKLSMGGFGGNVGQLPHAATTYAAVMTLAIVADLSDTEAAYSAKQLLTKIRLPLYVWFQNVLYQEEDGSFCMHQDGEADVRATYCVVAVAKLLNILSFSRAAEFCSSCQTWEGGFGGEPGAEAHGGYTYCAIAALQLLNRSDLMDTQAALGYLARRQMSMEGGFNGRANKLVDGCYSFWQGGAMTIISAIAQDKSRQASDPWLDEATFPTGLLFDQAMLERYILLCAQDVNGGLRDKPSKNRDFYHSCYNLSGLSVAQHGDPSVRFGHATYALVEKTHPCYNIRVDRVCAIMKYFANAAAK